MTHYSKKSKRLKSSFFLAVLLASVVCYVYIFNLMVAPEQQGMQQFELKEDKQEVSVPEAEIMKTVFETARDVFTIMSRKSI